MMLGFFFFYYLPVNLRKKKKKKIERARGNKKAFQILNQNIF